MRRCVRSTGVALACLFVGVAGMASPSMGKTALQVVQSGSERGLNIIKGSLSGAGPSLRERREEILGIVDDYFDFEEMARRSLGRPWKDLSSADQREFVRVFKQLLFNTYVARVEAAAAPDTRIVCEKEEREGDYAVVRTRVVSQKYPNVQIDYRLRLINGQWKAYDVIIEGISLVNNYRQQFISILNTESFSSLLGRLRTKVSEQQQAL